MTDEMKSEDFKPKKILGKRKYQTRLYFVFTQSAFKYFVITVLLKILSAVTVIS
jgi:hypothetical protein